MPSGTSRLAALLLAWFTIALTAGAAGLIAGLPPPGPQLLLLGLTVALLLLERRAAWLRSWVAAADLRSLVALHLTRFVGIAFLLSERRGLLPAAFAIPAGWGDILIAFLAGLLLISRTSPRSGGRTWYRSWNVLGFLDLIFVVTTAARLALTEPGSMDTLFRFPLSLVPTFLVPLLLASHLWVFRRLAGNDGRAAT